MCERVSNKEGSNQKRRGGRGWVKECERVS